MGGFDVELVLLEFMTHPENCVLFVPSVVQVEAGTEFGEAIRAKTSSFAKIVGMPRLLCAYLQQLPDNPTLKREA